MSYQHDPAVVGRVLKIKQVAEATGLSPSTIRRAVKEGRFPPPIPLSLKRRGWLEFDLAEWFTSRREALG